MQMTDSQRIEAPREKVWEALNDPEILKSAIPGCEELVKHCDTELEAKVKLKVGPVKATFGGKVTLNDLDPPNGYTIEGEGAGGVAGFARGGARVRLEEDGPDATILHYDVDAKVGGKLAQLGSRLIDSTAKRLAGSSLPHSGNRLHPRLTPNWTINRRPRQTPTGKSPGKRLAGRSVRRRQETGRSRRGTSEPAE